MNILTRDDLERLYKEREGVCVSIYTHPPKDYRNRSRTDSAKESADRSRKASTGGGAARSRCAETVRTGAQVYVGQSFLAAPG